MEYWLAFVRCRTFIVHEKVSCFSVSEKKEWKRVSFFLEKWGLEVSGCILKLRNHQHSLEKKQRRKSIIEILCSKAPDCGGWWASPMAFLRALGHRAGHTSKHRSQQNNSTNKPKPLLSDYNLNLMLDGHIMDYFFSTRWVLKMAVVFTPTETWEYLETSSEQRRDALILRHVQPFQFSALRAIYKFRQKILPSLESSPRLA